MFQFFSPISGKRRLLFPIVLPLVALACLAGTANSADAESGAREALIWESGPVSVHAVQDRVGEMSIDLFNGPASRAEREKYFTNGKAPAGVFTFLIRTGEKIILVDSGYGESGPGKSGLNDSLALLGIAPENVDLVLLTHMHGDHIGGLLVQKQRAFPKAQIMVSGPELEYWLALAEKEPGNANAAMVKSVVQVYGGDLLPPFAFDASPVPGITARNASGHTPGHTVFEVESGGKTLFIVGDLVHAASLQFPLPEECASYDINAQEAVKARKEYLGIAADKNIPVAGMHMPFPSSGKVERQGNGFLLIPNK